MFRLMIIDPTGRPVLHRLYDDKGDAVAAMHGLVESGQARHAAVFDEAGFQQAFRLAEDGM